MKATLMLDLGYGYVTLRMRLEETTGLVLFECAGCRHRLALGSTQPFDMIIDAVVEEFGSVHTHP